jgi:hypothetical protein
MLPLEGVGHQASSFESSLGDFNTQSENTALEVWNKELEAHCSEQ